VKKLLTTILVLLLLVLSSCSASDPVREDFYTTNIRNSGNIYTDSLIRYDGGGDGGYWHVYVIDAFSASPGTSGATVIPSNVSSLGGYRLDNIGEYLYFTIYIEDDWDGTTDGSVEIWFEVNVDNSGGLVTDTVEIGVECYHKIVGELGNTVISLEGSTIVGQSVQHELFKQTVLIGSIRANEVISFRLNLNTVFSEVDNIIVNYVEFKYQTPYPALEVP